MFSGGFQKQNESACQGNRMQAYAGSHSKQGRHAFISHSSQYEPAGSLEKWTATGSRLNEYSSVYADRST